MEMTLRSNYVTTILLGLGLTAFATGVAVGAFAWSIYGPDPQKQASTGEGAYAWLHDVIDYYKHHGHLSETSTMTSCAELDDHLYVLKQEWPEDSHNGIAGIICPEGENLPSGADLCTYSTPPEAELQDSESIFIAISQQMPDIGPREITWPGEGEHAVYYAYKGSCADDPGDIIFIIEETLSPPVPTDE